MYSSAGIDRIHADSQVGHFKSSHLADFIRPGCLFFIAITYSNADNTTYTATGGNRH
jgi:hypothetical protein